MDDAFAAYLQEEREQSAKALQQFVIDKVAAYSGLNDSFDASLDYLPEYITAGGKFGRPLLTRLAYATQRGQDAAMILQVSIAVELLHRFILAHDDVFDRDKKRHGIATYETYLRQYAKAVGLAEPDWFGLSGAVVAGDVMHALVFALLATVETPDAVRANMMRGFSSCLIETAAGWQLETALKQSPLSAMSEVEIVKAMQLVSAHYSVLWPLRIGQLAAGVAFGDWDEALETFGVSVGVAFQMQDDVLGVFGESEKTGKPVGNDIREGKKSLLIFKAYAKGSAADRAFMKAHMGKELPADELDHFQEIITDTGALFWVREKAKEEVERGLAALNQLEGADPQAVERLRQLARFLVQREY